MITNARDGSSLTTLATQIASSLASARVMEGRAFIRTPILFASGTALVAVVEAEPGGTWRISDLGQGHEEAMQLGVASTYLRRARAVAEVEGFTLERDLVMMKHILRWRGSCGIQQG